MLKFGLPLFPLCGPIDMDKVRFSDTRLDTIFISFVLLCPLARLVPYVFFGCLHALYQTDECVSLSLDPSGPRYSQKRVFVSVRR